MAADPPGGATIRPCRRRISCTVENAGDAIPSRLRQLAPRHGWPPSSRIHAMMMCRSCPRTPVGDVSGLNKKSGHDENNGVYVVLPRLALERRLEQPKLALHGIVLQAVAGRVVHRRV